MRGLSRAQDATRDGRRSRVACSTIFTPSASRTTLTPSVSHGLIDRQHRRRIRTSRGEAVESSAFEVPYLPEYIDTIHRLIGAWKKRDVEVVLALLTEEVVHPVHVGTRPLRGKT
jgi:hypothetical protein